MRQKSQISYSVSTAPSGRSAAGITITPLRGFFIALLFLGIPTVSLGSFALSLFQSNLRLSERNTELNEMAAEVKREVDSLGEEIDSLRKRAGVDSLKESAAGAKGVSSSVKQRGFGLPPRGGVARRAEAIELLEDAKKQVPELNKALDDSVKPALEETLAEEAAFPDGVPMVGRIQVSSEYGLRGNPFGGGGYELHGGIDFVGDVGDIIAATGDGVVILAGPNGGYGNTVTIDHGNKYETLYAHMSEVKVSVGDRVKRGQIIGYVGSTGRSSGPHLHYSVYKDKKAINPRQVLNMPESPVANSSR